MSIRALSIAPGRPIASLSLAALCGSQRISVRGNRVNVFSLSVSTPATRARLYHSAQIAFAGANKSNKSKKTKPASTEEEDGEAPANRTLSFSEMKQGLSDGPVDSVDAIRRKVFAEANVQKFKRDLNITDPLIARAYAEIEEEDRGKIAWKRARGLMTPEEEAQIKAEEEQMIAEGLNPKLGRWGQYLKQKKVIRKSKSLPEYNAATSTKFVKDRRKTLNAKKKSK